MSLSTSSSERSFLGRALLWLAVALGSALGLGALAGQFYQPKPLSPSRAEIESRPHWLLLFGNSRIAAAVDERALSAQLGEGVTARAYTGGGWDALHYLMLALLSESVLRPGQDAVLIEVSPLSLNDHAPESRLGVIRPETSWTIATLSGAPLEARLDILLGAVAPLYRYRPSVQSALENKLRQAAKRLMSALEGLGWVSPSATEPAYELVTDPERDYVIREVRGDAEALRRAARESFGRELSGLSFGGYKRAALALAVSRLRARGVAVYLVEVPVSEWLAKELAAAPGRARYEEFLRELSGGGAVLLRGWDASLQAPALFFDEMHMMAQATEGFTRALASALKTRGAWWADTAP
jgi:hypothetical protein